MIRRVLITFVCAVAGAWSLPALGRAGTYHVLACQADGANHSWNPSTSNGLAGAYIQCPVNPDNANEGMVARNTGGPGLASWLSNANVSFGAPAGARIVNVKGWIKQSSTGGWDAGIYDGSANRWVWCGVGCTSTFGTWVAFNIPMSSNLVQAAVICGRGQGCDRNAVHGYAALRDVDVTVAEDGKPTVAIRPVGLAAGVWRRGVQDLVVDATDPSGVRTLSASVDGKPIDGLIRTCDPTLVSPCPNGAITRRVDTRSLPDGAHVLRVVAVDAAGNSNYVQRAIYVDNHGPAQPLGLSVDGGTAWRSTNTFSLRWGLPADSGSPVAGAYVQLCPPLAEKKACQASRWVGGATSVAVKIPSVGEWRARVVLQDTAGNRNPANTVESVLRFDDAAPVVTLRRPSPDRPAWIQVVASDVGSGVSSGEVLLRRRGSSSWMSLPVTMQPGGFGVMVNDEALPDGIYEVRVRALDAAGNERSADHLADGKAAQVVLPLRVKTALRVGRPTRVRAREAQGERRFRVKLVAAPRARFGRTIPLRGRLTSPGGNPLVSEEVQVFERTTVPAAPWRLIATLKTSRTGRFTFKALRGPSRTLRFRFGGSDTIRGRTADVRLGVRAATTFRVSPDHVVNGEAVTFGGHVRGRPLPATGKLIELQARTRGGWRTFATTRASHRTGRWSYVYRFSATRGSVRYRFRARLPKESGYPYEAGVSRPAQVMVRGI